MAKYNLIDSFFDKRHGFEAAVICTYGLNLHFFEKYLLKLNALYPCDHIALFVDSQTYDQFLHHGYTPHALNRRYLVSRLKTKGVFHPKLYLMASAKKAMIGIGSANLTREGIASNLELLATFEVTEKDPTFSPLLADCLTYVQRLAQLTQSKRAQEQVAALADCCRPLAQPAAESGGAVRLLHNLDRPLLQAIEEKLSGLAVTKAQIISPFFDSGLTPLHELLTLWPACQTELYVQQRKSNLPKHQLEGLPVAVNLYQNIDRYLHGKAILFHTAEGIYLFMGSANFTKSALCKSSAVGNFEVALMEKIDAETAAAILQPTGQEASPVQNLADIEVDPQPEFVLDKTALQVDYLIEAVLENKQIQLITNDAIDADQFRPERYRLVDFKENHVEGVLPSDLTIILTNEASRRIQGRFGIQLIGADSEGQIRYSNLAWVIDWDERVGDKNGRYLRRIYNDPFQLYDILIEIVSGGDEQELMLFLQRFDIPLDLLLPPRSTQGPRHVASKGNVIGTLPLHNDKFFSDNILAAFDACLNRLLDKMRKHINETQPDKISNFVLIFNSFLSFLDSVNRLTSKKYREKAIITSEDWLFIRNCYDMLLKHTMDVWEVVWSKNGYRNRINARLAERQVDDEEAAVTFEAFLLADYGSSLQELQKQALQPLQTFQELQNALKIRKANGQLASPRVFPTNHFFLDREALSDLRRIILSETARFAPAFV